MANGDNSGSPLSPVIGETSFSEAISEAVNKTVFPETALTQSSVVSPAQQPLAQSPVSPASSGCYSATHSARTTTCGSHAIVWSCLISSCGCHTAARCPLLVAFFTYVAAAAAFRAVGLWTCFACVAAVAWSAS